MKISKRLLLSLVMLAPMVGGFFSPINGQNSRTQKSGPGHVTVSIYRTAKDTEERLTRLPDTKLEDYGQPPESQPCVFIDPDFTFQSFIGIGAALTDASAEVFAKLPAGVQKEFLEAHFTRDKGIGYTFTRTNIGSCDFSSDSYDYVAENDSALKTFSLSHDEKFKIPLIKKAKAMVGADFKLFASPWSPPAWMKSNNDRLHGGSLLEPFKQPWANHFVKFIRGYEKLGIPVWGITVQNEPMAKQIWESCIMTDEEERDFVKKYLGPTLKREGLSDTKLMVWDHNRDLIFQRTSTIFSDPEASKYIWGIGFHWYEPWSGGNMQFENLNRVTECFPDKPLVFTEGCAESFKMSRIEAWELGEKYGTSMVSDFNSGTVAWTDWNILLDEKGGPNHVGNFCFAPVHADLSTGKLIYTNSYYYIGHFSKFILPGAKRISCSTNRDLMKATAFLNPDGKIVVIVLNTSEKNYAYKLWLKAKAATVECLPHSITTLIL